MTASADAWPNGDTVSVAAIRRAEGIPPGPQRPMTWRTVVHAHWPAHVAADFFTTEVWTVRGRVTYYTAFVLGSEWLS